MTKWDINAFTLLGILGVVICFGIGWSLNIIALLGMIDGPLTGMMVMRGIGIFVAPLGVILGYFF